MKTMPYHRHRPQRSTRTLLVFLLVSAALLAGIIALTSCGGTISISPAGELSYTTPRLIQPIPAK